MENKIKMKKNNPFVMISHNFIKGELLNWNEKDMYIILSMYANQENECFPSVPTLEKVWGKSKNTVLKAIKGLEEKGILEKKGRITEKGQTSNLYILKDYDELWSAKTTEEAKEIVTIEEKKKKFYELAAELNFDVIEKKEPESSHKPTKAKEETDSTNINNANSLELNYTAVSCDCQEMCENQGQKQEKNEIKEQYPLEMLKEHYEYEIMVFDNKNIQTDIDTAFSVLYEAMNTTKETIRIKSEDKPIQVVISKLLKLTRFGILYAIDKYKEQTNRIDYPTSYLLTLLYEAEAQQNLEIINRVNHDMAQVQQNQIETEEQKEQEQNGEENQSISRKEQTIEEYNNYSEKEKNEMKNKYIEIMFKEKFDKKGAISDLEKEWASLTIPTNQEKIKEQGESMPLAKNQ